MSLKDYKGRWVVLYFYPKDFTTGCTLEAHNFERDLAWIAASSGVAVDATFSLASPFPAAKDRSFSLAHNTIPIRTADKNRFMRISLPATAPVKKRPLQCAVRYKKFEE